MYMYIIYVYVCMYMYDGYTASVLPFVDNFQSQVLKREDQKK